MILRTLSIGAMLTMLATVDDAGAQSSVTPMGASPRPVVGGTSGVSRPVSPPRISGSEHLEIMRHRDPSGKPCLAVYGFARTHSVNPSLYDHVVAANNRCTKLIKVKVCYYRSQQCIWLDVPSRGRKETVLGLMPSLSDFRFEFREMF